MKMNMPAVIFTLQARELPAEHRAWLKELGCRKSDRHTEDFPIWWRIDGKGYTLWLSEIRLADSTATPPTWHFKLEALTVLPQVGIERWDMSYESIQQFLRDARIPYVVSEATNSNA